MPGRSRALPGRPNLRYLRLEAKRRLIPVNAIDAALLRAWTNPPKE